MSLKHGLTDQDLLQLYRRDRTELLTFVLTAGILEKVVMPPGAVTFDEVNLDEVSVNHVLDCARKGVVLELWEAMRRFQDDLTITTLVNPCLRKTSFCAREHDFSGPAAVQMAVIETAGPPQLVPSAPRECTADAVQSQQFCVDNEDSAYGDQCIVENSMCATAAGKQLHDTISISVDLPPFMTGLSDDDLRETAYEVLLASVGGAGGLLSATKEKSSKLSRHTKNISNRFSSRTYRAPGLAGLLETMRIQMEISESSDTRTREALLRAAAGRVGKRMDTLLVPLELLCVVTSEDFRDQRTFTSWERRQLNLLKEGLVNHPCTSFDTADRLRADLRLSIQRIEESQALAASAGTMQRTNNLQTLKGIAIALAEGSNSGEQSGDFCHWADGYHLNVRLYERLLNSIFDKMGEGHIVEEVEEILELLKSTWRVLGITQTVHDTCYTWVLFRQFVLTGKAILLDHATQQMKRIASDGQRGARERSYMKSLCSTSNSKHGSQKLSYVQAVLIPIKLWADKRLENYHVNFSEDLGKMDLVVTIAMIASRLIADEIDQVGNNQLSSTAEVAVVAKQAKEYMSTSLTQAFEQVLEAVDSRWESQNEHPLALLAEEVKGLANRDISMFVPILNRWHPQAQALSASLLHGLYHQELKPFIEAISNLTEDVTSVLSAADSLEEYLRQLVLSASDDKSSSYKQEMIPYQVEVIASNLIIQWVNIQLTGVSECIEEAIKEEMWEAVSSEERHGPSVVKVFQLIELIVNQFFGLKLPMRIPLLRSLLNSLDGALQLYANRTVTQLGNIADLVPSLPTLARHKKDTVVKVLSKKKPAENMALDEKRISEINHLTTARLSVCLNTLHYLSCKADALEENIKEQWSIKNPNDDLSSSIFLSHGSSASDGDTRSRHISRSSEEFSIGLESSRKVTKVSIDTFCEFAGTKIIFWDMRESFIDNLYKTSISQSRIAKVISGLDAVLGQLCEMIVEPLRDQVVLSLLQASLDGLIRVLLDGGSLRCFAQSDAGILEEDLKILKNFFVADGDGLPKSLVDSTAAPVHQVIELYNVETWIVIENFKHANDQSSGSNTSHKAGSRIQSDTDTLLRVLCHRPDREASRFLKQHKLPKSLDN